MKYAFVELVQAFSQGEDAFLRAHPAPWLVLRASDDADDPVGHTAIAEVLTPFEPETDLICHSLVKSRAGYAFAQGITVGHTENNDVVLRDASVSRFHAYFQNELTAPAVVDPGSRNGTFLEGTRLERGKPYPLQARSRLRFGSLEADFYPASSFMELLRARHRP